MTLIEVLVTGGLFAVVLTMIAQAMVVGHRAQSGLSHRIDVHRQAANALDLLVRDVEMARYSTFLRYQVGLVGNPVPTSVTVVDSPNELRVVRMQAGTTLYDAPERVVVSYWRNPVDSTFRRTLYDSTGSAILSGTPPDGKVIARDVKRFDIKMEANPVTGLSTLTTRLNVATMGDPVKTEISLET